MTERTKFVTEEARTALTVFGEVLHELMVSRSVEGIPELVERINSVAAKVGMPGGHFDPSLIEGRTHDVVGLGPAVFRGIRAALDLSEDERT